MQVYARCGALFQTRGGKEGWKSRERREDRSRPLQRGRDTGGTKKEKAFLLPCHTCCSTIRKIRRIPRMEIVLAIDLPFGRGFTSCTAIVRFSRVSIILEYSLHA